MDNEWRVLWGRWTVANGLAELVGLGGTFAILGLLITRINTTSIAGILLAFLLTIASGAFEATLVGLAQWWVMHPWFPEIRRIAWWRGTLIGALIGYGLGYLPSTLMSMGNSSPQASQVEPPPWITLLLAAGLGIVAGAVLSFAQWLVLRGHAKRTGLWIPANMLAWAFGMPTIFLGMDLAFKMSAAWQSVLVVGGAILIAGLVVGAVHGSFLVVMAGEKQPE